MKSMEDIIYNVHPYVDKNRVDVIAVTAKWYGKTYKGIAKCHPDDNYDCVYGVKLATQRCKRKIAAHELKYISAKIEECKEIYTNAFNEMERWDSLRYNVAKEFADTVDFLNEIRPDKSVIDNIIERK